ncbi:MAG: ATP-binding protein [Elusimicrobiota bacterium]|nr:ATP-binding protein [Elusimicrobiota bacterium]
MKRKSGFFRKFFLVMIFISVIPLFFMGLRAVIINTKLSGNVEKISSNSLETAILDKQNRLSEWMAGSIDDYFSGLLRNVPRIAENISAKDVSAEQRRRIMITEYNTGREFLSLALLTSPGKVRMKIPDNWEYSAGSVAKLAGGKPKFAFGEVYFVEDSPVIDFIYRCPGGEYLYIAISLESILGKIKGTPSQIGEDVFIVSSSGRIILHPDLAKMDEKRDISFIPLISEFLTSRSPLSKGDFNGIKNIPMIGSISPVSRLGWGVVVWQTKTTAYAQVGMVKNEIKTTSRQLIKQTYIQIFVISLAAFWVAFALAKSISRPIMELSGGAQRVAARDFSTRVKVDSADEIGALAEIFNQMMDELQKYDRMQVDKLDALVYSIKDGLIMIDHNGRILMANEKSRAILNMLEFAPDEDLSTAVRRSSDVFPPAAIASEIISELLNSEEENPKSEIDMSHEDMPKFYEVSRYSVLTRDKINLGSIITLRDVTLEKELAKMKDDFLHSITHDLRSPMTSIRGFLELLLDGSAGEVNEEQESFLKIMDESSEKLLGMINNLLDVSKLEAGKMVLNLKDADLSKIASTIVDFFYPQAKSLKINLSFQCASAPGKINIDENLVERVITNLVSNAMKFTPAGGSVTVDIADDAPSPGFLTVSVKDTGKGIPEGEVNRVFEKFHQVADTALKKTGTGLGLTVCKYIVEAHLGSIGAKSVFGKGSEFSFYIPKDLIKENGEVRRKSETL